MLGCAHTYRYFSPSSGTRPGTLAALASLNLINQTAYPSAQNSSGTHYPCMGWTVAPASIRLQPIKTALCGRPEDILLHLWQADLRFYPLMFADILLKGESTCLAWSGIFCLFVCVSVFAFILRLDHLVTFFLPHLSSIFQFLLFSLLFIFFLIQLTLFYLFWFR